ncbi:hypothetical protein [Burkholderia dolosa]|uniref:hypothetical protein n=1 Tax=Burkholderia dolosa TaxID=152500 RepID=UPI0027D2B757|nr:hypothetical protein [Burkholderia dolosa]
MLDRRESHRLAVEQGRRVLTLVLGTREKPKSWFLVLPPVPAKIKNEKTARRNATVIPCPILVDKA